MSVNLLYAPMRQQKHFKSTYTSNTIACVRELFPDMHIKLDDMATVHALAVGSSYRDFWEEVEELLGKYGEIVLSTEA